MTTLIDERPVGRTPRNVSLDLLSRREHSAHELRGKLRTREFDDAEIEVTLAKLQAEGLQSDARFAEMFVTSRLGRGYGPMRMRADLERRGVSAELIAELLGAGTDWVERARMVRGKRFGNELPADFRERARQSRFLSYRGFTAEQVRAAVGRHDDD